MRGNFWAIFLNSTVRWVAGLGCYVGVAACNAEPAAVGGWQSGLHSGPEFSYPNQAPTDQAVRPVSPYHLAITLDPQTITALDGAQANAWSLQSDDDPRYAQGLSPENRALRLKAQRLIPQGWPFKPVIGGEAVLQWASPLQAGARYVLTVSGRATPWRFTFDPNRLWSPAVKVNQVGYLTDAPGRFAYVSYWLAGLSPPSLTPDQRRFRVVEAAGGRTVFSGQLRLRLAHDGGGEDAYGKNYHAADIYEMDLSALTTSGYYYLIWEGVGRSNTFAVRQDLYDAPFVTVFRALYHQRCGVALEDRYTQWTRATGHQGPVQYTTRDYHGGGDHFHGLPAAATGVTAQITGGYHDAGDYDRRIEHLVAVDALVDLYEIFPDRFGRDDFGLPESGNGLPDVLDEAWWALALYSQLQEADGGVRAGIETTGHPARYGLMPAEDPAVWYAYGTDPLSSYRFAGAAAKLARVWRGFDAAKGEELLERARRAFAWAENHRPQKYGTKGLDAYAAAELFKSTNEAAYEAAFLRYAPLQATKSQFEGLKYSALVALYAYASTPGVNPPRRQQAVSILVQRLEAWHRLAPRSGYRLFKHPYAPVIYGTYTTPRETDHLFRAHVLTGDARFLRWGLQTVDASLGHNAHGLSWTTGIGVRAVERPLSNPALGDGIDPAIPGLTVFGPDGSERPLDMAAFLVPHYQPPLASWPAAERFSDLSYVPIFNEYTVHESIVPTAFAFGYLSLLRDGE